MHSTKKNIICISIIFAFTALLYGSYLSNPIVFDDIYFFIDINTSIKQYTNLSNVFDARFLSYSTIAWTAKLFGLDLINLRISSLLLHASTGVALFFFLKEIYQLAIFSNTINRLKIESQLIALCGAVIFVLHPVAVYAAGYLIQRSIVMATLFSLMSLYYYLYSTRTNRPYALAPSLIFYLLAILSKEHAIMLPAVTLVASFLIQPNLFKNKKVIAYFSVAALIAIYIILQKSGIFGTIYEVDALPMLTNQATENSHPFLFSIIGQCSLFFKYLLLWLLPDPAWMSIDMREPFANSLWSPQSIGLAGFIAYGAFAGALILKRNEKSMLGIAMLFPWLLFFTEFSAVRIQESFVLYRSYLWMPGLFIALPLTLNKIDTKRLMLLMLILVSGLMAISINRLNTFTHPLLLWTDAKYLLSDRLNLPGEDRIYYNTGVEFNNIKDHQKAENDIKIAINLRPKYSPYHLALGIVYLDSGNYSFAIQKFDDALELDNTQIKAYQGLGLAYKKLGEIDKARESLTKGCNLGWAPACIELNKL